MKLNRAGINLIKICEGCRITAYPDPATGDKPFTIGYGTTGPDVLPGMTITMQQAEALLANDLSKVVDNLLKMIKIELNDNQFSAIVSLVYNIGETNFSKSTMLKMINAGGIDKAAAEFTRWDRAAGKEMPGLLKRRLLEQKLYKS